MSLPGRMAAATTAKAADEGSPGTTRSRPLSSGQPTTVMRLPPPSARRHAATSAPKWRSMRSVWSRVGSGSITVVSPAVLRPASRMALFTCAEATGRR